MFDAVFTSSTGQSFAFGYKASVLWSCDPLGDLPDSVTAPDTYPARTDAVFFMADADSTNRLNLRAGPGLAYDILGKISSSTLRVYGYSSAAPGWALVRYDPLYDVPQFGWVSTAYLISAE